MLYAYNNRPELGLSAISDLFGRLEKGLAECIIGFPLPRSA